MERDQVERAYCDDLIKELRTLHGIVADSTARREDLVDMLQLAESLRRRAEISRIGLAKFKIAKYPQEMSLKSLQLELRGRRVKWFQLTHAKAAQALEECLLKEDMVRAFVSVFRKKC